MPLSPDSKSRLSTVIRSLRARLLSELADAVRSEYVLDLPADHAGLNEARSRKRARLEAWVAERVRATECSAQDALAHGVKEAAATLVNRLVVLRLMESMPQIQDGQPLRRLAVVSGGWDARGYRHFRDWAGPLLDPAMDATEGYAFLLELVFDELALDLPGLFGRIGITELIPVPPATLRHVITALNDPLLAGDLNDPHDAGAWDDDTTLGWIYQYWNDPEREALDAKIKDGGKIEPHEIASKTQMFTERYMVEWLLQNSVGPTWLAMCRKNGWRAEADDVLPVLEDRRALWRQRREAGEVPPHALMPVAPGLEDRWKYYVPQDLPQAAVDAAPDSIRALKLLDPACGSGHFLVIAFDLLAALYAEEARHRGTDWQPNDVARWIVEDNLHGLDIDPRAVQIAAAALHLKAKCFATAAQPARMNLVAPAFNLAGLPENDPALMRLVDDLEREAGLPAIIVRGLITALAGADHLGTLLKVEDAVKDVVLQYALHFDRHRQGDLLDGAAELEHRLGSDPEAAILARIEDFLSHHTAADDLGLRLDGEQLAAGIRFIRMMRPGTYHVVVGNPPYLGVGKTDDSKYIATNYPDGKVDVFAAFYLRGLALAQRHGCVSMVTPRNWLFIHLYAPFRNVLCVRQVGLVADLHWGAFGEMKDVAAAMSVCWAFPNTGASTFLRPVDPAIVIRDNVQMLRNMSGLAAPHGKYTVTSDELASVKGSPFIYWWNAEFRNTYRNSPKLDDVSPARFGLTTGDNGRFVRFWHEVQRMEGSWAPFILGAKDRVWFEPLRDVLRWQDTGTEVKQKCLHDYGTVSKQIRNEDSYFSAGVAFTMIGKGFSGRAHRFPSIIGNMGSSVFPNKEEFTQVLCLMNSTKAKFVLESLNPTTHFEVGDVNRLPVFPIEGADDIFARLETAFSEHEAARESSVEFRRPGPSCWDYAQAWAQAAVDRPAGAPLPEWQPVWTEALGLDHVSFALGAALGRFGANGDGVLDWSTGEAQLIEINRTGAATPTALTNQDATSFLPQGILFVSAAMAREDSLDHPACRPLLDAWSAHGSGEMRDWLRKKFFALHRDRYDNRPIFLPLSSESRNFVAFVSIHRWNDRTLTHLLADHLIPERRALEGVRDDALAERAEATGPAKAKADKRFGEIQDLLGELESFIRAVETIANAGPPKADDKDPARETDAPFVLDLDDGVIVNSAALWPLLLPQGWKDPRKWWSELARAQGKKNYDWSHLAARYWPARVDKACRKDPSLAVAHACFWRYWPERAYTWELRLQDEIGPDFEITEPDSNFHRQAFLEGQPDKADEILRKEMLRRERKRAKAGEEDDAAVVGEEDEPQLEMGV